MAKKPKFRLIPIKSIKYSKLRWERDHSEASIKEIMVQIAAAGLINPITLREHKGNYELLAGDKRLRACKRLGLVSIDAHVMIADDNLGERIGIYENSSQEEIPQSEMDEKISRAVELETQAAEEGTSRGQIIDTVALKTHRKPRAVRDAVRRNSKLVPQVKEALKTKKISKSHAESLESLDPATQRATLKNIIKEGLTVQQVEDKKADTKAAQAEDKDAAYLATARRYLTGALSQGDRFRQTINSLNEHIEAHKIQVSDLVTAEQCAAFQAIMTTLDWTFSILSGDVSVS